MTPTAQFNVAFAPFFWSSGNIQPVDADAYSFNNTCGNGRSPLSRQNAFGGEGNV
jgi:hypothetical protein